MKTLLPALWIVANVMLQFPFLVSGQNTAVPENIDELPDTLKMEIYLSASRLELDNKNYPLAFQMAYNALKAGINIHDPEFNANCHLIMASALMLQNNNQEALNYYFRALSSMEKTNLKAKMAHVNQQIGLIYLGMQIYNKASEFLEKAFQQASVWNDTILIASCSKQIAICFTNQKHYQKAIEYYELAYNYNASWKNTKEQIAILDNMASVYKKQKEYNNALSKYLEMKEILRNSGNIISLNMVINNIGYMYVFLEEYEKAKFAFLQTLMLDEQLKSPPGLKARSQTNLAICYQHLSDYPNCFKQLQNALENFAQTNDLINIARIRHLMAMVYIQTDDYYNAREYANLAIGSAEKANDFVLMQQCYETMANILRETGEFESSIQYYQRFLSLRDSLLVEQKIKEQMLSEKQFELEKTEKELKLLMAGEEMKDLALKQLKLEAEKRDKELALLKRENEIQELEKQKTYQSLVLAQQQKEALIRKQEIQNLEKEKEIQNLALKQKEAEEKERKREIELLQTEKEKQQLKIDKQNEQRKKFIYTSLLFTTLFIIILVNFIITRKKNRLLAMQKSEIEQKNSDLQQKNEEIEAQKDQLIDANEEILTKNEELNAQNEQIIKQSLVIEKKNKNITDSIQYAKRIQEALLPPYNFLSDLGIEHFILFKPRDIVSGDFYWMKKNNNFLFVALADCTGHGVPGAFMSMLGMSFLNDIIIQREILETHLVLNELKSTIKQSLRQTGKFDEAKDGMDIVLCRIDLSTLQVQFSGANNPLYLVKATHTGKDELIEFKADAMPIGIYYKEKESFSLHEAQLQKGDALYFTSDGYIDQFGGPNGRKFLSKNFKNLLLQIHEKSMQEQQIQLNETIENWKGIHFEQIDDIAVLGIRV